MLDHNHTGGKNSLAITIYRYNKGITQKEEGKNDGIEIIGIKIAKINFSHKTINQSFIGEGGKRRLTSKDQSKMTILIKTIGTCLNFLNDLRNLAFSGEKSLYIIQLEDGAKISGNFIITAFNLVSESSEMAEITWEIKNSGKITYTQ